MSLALSACRWGAGERLQGNVMQTLEGLQKKIKTAHGLLSVVKTMKTLAAVNIRQFETAAHTLDEFSRIVDMGWQVFFRHQPALPDMKRENSVVLIVFGSDQGMCGQFNESMADLARTRLDNLVDQKLSVFLWTIGERVMTRLEDTQEVHARFNLPGAIQGINEEVGTIVSQIDTWQQKKGTTTFFLLHNEMIRSTGYQAVQKQLLPLDGKWLEQHRKQPWPGNCLPQQGIAGASLFRHLFRHYLFVSIFNAFAQSMAAENAARLTAMQSAEKNILETEENLQAQFRETRQSAITAELFDVITGFEALTDEQ